MGLKQMEPVVEKVGGYKFYIRPFPAFKAANLTGELASVLAPFLGALAPMVNGKKNRDLMDMDAGEAASALAGCSSLDGNKLEKLLQKLLLGGHVVVEAPNEDEEIEAQVLDMDLANELFCGEVQDLFVLCFHVIKLNFNGFFKRLAAQSGKEESEEAAKKPRKVL